MRRGLAVLLFLIVLVPPAGAHTVGDPGWVNFLLDHFQTPDLAPGESGELSFTFNNTYPWRMLNPYLTLEIYEYREIDVARPVDANWSGPGPYFVDLAGARERFIHPPIPTLNPGNHTDVTFVVETYPDTQHGSLTKQGSYFVRTRLEFDFPDSVANHSVMMSKGWFTDAQWDVARTTCPSPSAYCVGLLNLTYLGGVYGFSHIDGLLPDTAFSVKDRMPLWPYLAVGAIMVASLVFAILFYAEENPGKYPRLARWWLGMKGKARGVRPPKPQ